ncbi:MAG: CDP-glucose 4,6-dehydratase [Desulfamplus sp.]|nr:CDP-glucose 4,6-dehydratase [Desulfamplus sp.]
MKKLFGGVYFGKKVLITGHTGFKGSWLALWLSQMGADIIGYSLQPPTNPNHFDLLGMKINSIIGDIRNLEKLKQVFKEHKPEIVFHLAAQPIVRISYINPIETFSSNVMGTVNIFEASRAVFTVKAIVNITSDKCYENENKEWLWGYREVDPVGGFDPYSASKGCAELITNCWRNSFFNLKDYNTTHQTLIASCRAGNVIGGGDWAVDRLVPDLVRSASKNESVKIRNPSAVRPWQHVLEPLSGYLLLGQKLLDGYYDFAEAWNFGPSDEDNATVVDIANMVKKSWSKIRFDAENSSKLLCQNQPHEAGILKLDCSKSRAKLKWLPVWDIKKTIEKTSEWYRAFYEFNEIKSLENISSYISDAENKNMEWVK